MVSSKLDSDGFDSSKNRTEYTHVGKREYRGRRYRTGREWRKRGRARERREDGERLNERRKRVFNRTTEVSRSTSLLSLGKQRKKRTPGDKEREV